MSAQVIKWLITAGVGALVLMPASAPGATYGGHLNKGGRIGVGVSVDGGHPQYVKEVDFKKVPATCASAGHRRVTGGIKYADPGLRIRGGEFKTEQGTIGSSPYVFHTGHFKNSAHKLVGKFQVTVKTRFHDGSRHDCTTKRSWYVTHRGASAPGLNSAKLGALMRYE